MSPGRISERVVVGKLDVIGRSLEGIQSLPLSSVAEFTDDPRMVAAGESYLRRGLEALLDLGRHVLAKGFGRPTAEYKQIPSALREVGVLDERVTERFSAMAGYRNRLVHFYDEIGPEELFVILTSHLDDVVLVRDTLRQWIDAEGDVDRSL